MTPNFQALMHNAARLTRTGQLSEATAVIQAALAGGAVRPHGSAPAHTHAPASRHAPGTAHDDAAGGKFLAGSHTDTGASLTRDFKLYVPPGMAGRALPLVVMLHGCTQNPDDFAAGTGMNALAAEQGCYVLYPAQALGANPSHCWNWFKHNHQERGRGEPAVVASMTLATMQAHGIDAQRVYVAGLSAGGAMAAIVGAAYPDLFAAVGVHSGLAPGAARNLPEALAAMHGAPAGTTRRPGAGMHPGAVAPSPAAALPLPVIVFHGDQDQTVHPRNGDQVIDAALRAGEAQVPYSQTAGPGGPQVERGVSAHGRRYTRSVHQVGAGHAVAEHWLLHGAGHAWSGGRGAGSYTDPQGPDASREMLRFFLAHPRRPSH
jgi:poly(hydroxyalkanoate) depolymerase family esterase